MIFVPFSRNSDPIMVIMVMVCNIPSQIYFCKMNIFMKFVKILCCEKPSVRSSLAGK